MVFSVAENMIVSDEYTGLLTFRQFNPTMTMGEDYMLKLNTELNMLDNCAPAQGSPFLATRVIGCTY